MSKLVLIIEADTNNADYIISEYEIKPEELIKLQPVFDAIKAKRFQENWPCSDYVYGSPEELYKGILTQEQIDLFDDLFDDFRPYGENGIHTIKSIKVLEVANEIKYV